MTRSEDSAFGLLPVPPFSRQKGKKETTADQYLLNAANEISARAVLRDKPYGERSMAKAVLAFKALFGESLDTETKGWQFMLILKLARMSGGTYHEDDYVDAIGYAALAAESAAKE